MVWLNVLLLVLAIVIALIGITAIVVFRKKARKL